MADKRPKRPNDNAKALESWESEGGTPASDDRLTKKKRPRDLNQWAKRMLDIAAGEVEERDRSKQPKEKGTAHIRVRDASR
jgi:hypothetical protein